MMKKIDMCEKWGVQITDCRYRPLDIDYDDYNPSLRHGQPTGVIISMINQDGLIKKSGILDLGYANIIFGLDMQETSKGRPYDRKMEKWSDIHAVFKFFKMGRPPQLEVIEASPKWKKRIQIMNKIKRYFKIHGKLSPFDFRGFNIKRIDDELKTILNDLYNNGDTLTNKGIESNNKQLALFMRDVDYSLIN